MTRRIAAVSLLLGALVLAGCQDPDLSKSQPGPRDFCDAFLRLDDKISTGKATQQEQYELVKEAVRTAPDVIKADGQTFLEGFQRLQNGESAAAVQKDESKYRKASENFQRWGNQHCGIYKRQGM